MTSFEFVYGFQMKLETLSKEFEISERPDTDTILSYINLGQLKYFNDKYLNKGSFKENAEFLRQIANDDLANLIQTTGAVTMSTTTLQGHPTAYRYTTELAQYAHYIDSYSYMTRSQPKAISSPEWVINLPANSMEDLRKIETNWYNKPILRNPIVFLDGSANITSTSNFYIYAVADSYTTLEAASNFNLRYIRRPKSLAFTVGTAANETTTCELASYLHEEILQVGFEIFKAEKLSLIPKA